MTTGNIDLHVHTTASDGTLSPAEVVREAAAQRVSLLGIADHDTTEGVPAAQEEARRIGLLLVPGVELSVGAHQREIHVLGYFLDLNNEKLRETLSTLRGARDARNQRIISRLNELGAPVNEQRIHEIAGGGSIGRPHIAKALVEAGHVASQGEAFGRYLARGKPAYVHRERLSAAEAARLIRQADGIPVLAHPAKIGSRQEIEAILDQGMDGIEVFHSDHDQRHVDLLMDLARSRNLLITGGTDSHGPHSDRPITIGALEIPQWVGEQIIQRAPYRWAEQR